MEEQAGSSSPRNLWGLSLPLTIFLRFCFALPGRFGCVANPFLHLLYVAEIFVDGKQVLRLHSLEDQHSVLAALAQRLRDELQKTKANSARG